MQRIIARSLPAKPSSAILYRMNPKKSPSALPERFHVFELLPNRVRRSAGFLEGSFVGIRQAAESASELVFSRAHCRQVTVVLDSRPWRGVFIAHGRVGWKRYAKGEVVNPIKFLIEEEKER